MTRQFGSAAEALVRARYMTAFNSCVRSLGGNPSSILGLVGLQTRDIEDPARWISFKSCLRALQLAARTLNEPAFGIKLQRSRDFSFLGPLLLIAQHSENLTAALLNVSRYLSIQNTGYRTAFVVGPETCVRSYEMAPELRLIADQFIEESLLSTRKMIALITGDVVPVIHYSMRHRPLRSQDAYLEDYGAPVLFEQEFDGVVIDRKFADHEIPNRDPNIQKFVLNYLEERILPTSGEVISATRSLLEALVPMGQAKIEVVAQHLHMHPRTLQRRLNEHGCSFSQLLEEKRRMMAERLLRDGNLPLSNIASYLGYAEQSAFNHAFGRWHGQSPSKWTKQAAQTQGEQRVAG
ncbi:MAG TPA: AraC family transcriptional regulator ligand-binding domain-containing protein [Rhizomicrobium sp.]|nr:AraC family transcriptional regulator ligand-binding domain-containing protein [Rhizomicrobium sp.]